jgi:hypothetical protein
MRVVTKRAQHLVSLAVIIAGLLALLILPLSPGGATSLTHTAGQNPSPPDLDKIRVASLQKLYSDLEAGSSFAEEERAILRTFNAGGPVTELEADILISRALYDFYVAGTELTREQEELLARYEARVSRRSIDVADLKTRLLDRRKAAAAASEKVEIVPLVPPGNDLCAGAEVIPAAGPFPHLTSVTADVTDATTTGDPSLPSCQTVVSRSIWYRFTPSATATYTLSTCSIDGTATTVDDTVMAIYTSSTGACGGVLSEIPTGHTTDGCGDDECVDEALQAVIATQLTAGTAYFILVWEFDAAPPTAGNTAVQLKVTQDLPPSNDTCAAPTPLVLNTPVNGSTEFGNDNYRLSGSGCFTGVGNVASTAEGRDVVFSFTAPFADTYSVRVTRYVESGLSNLVVYAASSCPAAGLTPVTVGSCLAAANRDADNTAEEIFCRSLSSNQQIFIFVDENTITDGSPFVIEVTRCGSESGANDTPGTANPIRFGIEGSINPGGDVDFFSLGAPVTGSRVFALIDGIAGNSTDFDLRVTTTTDTLEFDDSNADAEFGFASPTVAGTMATGAPAFIRVNQSAATAAEPYRLYSVVQPPIASATAESEPNDTTAAADSAANNYFTGSLSGPAPSIDVDLFSFFATAGDLIFLSLDGDPLRNNTPINAAVALLDAGGVELVSVNDGSLSSSTTSGAGSLTSVTPFSPSEAIAFRATTSGTYFARVTIGTSSAGAEGAGDYLLSISRNGLTGSCTYSISPTGQFFPLEGGSSMVAVTAGTGCAWTAVSDTPSFITINSGGSGTGNGSVNYTVAPNSTCAARSGTITIAGQTFVVNQASAGCADTIGLFRPSGNFFFLRNSNTFGPPDTTVSFGAPGDLPIVGDWDGDGDVTIGLYRPSSSTFFLRNSNSLGAPDITLSFGDGPGGDLPIAGDWDGNGTWTIGVYRPGTSTFFIRNSNTFGVPDITITFGAPGDMPLAGDWDGNGTMTIGLFRPSGNGFFLRNSNTFGPPDITLFFGAPGDLPIVGDWDGNVTMTIGLFRPSGNLFFLRNSNVVGPPEVTVSFGAPGDKAIVGNWDGL